MLPIATHRFVALVTAVLFALPLQYSAAQSQEAEHSRQALAGVNVINPYLLSEADQDAMLDAIHGAGVHVIRVSITLDDKGAAFAEKAWKHGVQIDWLIYRFGGFSPFNTPLSAADPESFRKTFQPLLASLEAKGVVFAAFELGNEINLSGSNPDFLKPSGRARQLSLDDLEHDPQGQRVASGFRQYIKVLAVLKELRDHSKLNNRTPITTAGLGSYDQDDGPLPGWVTGDIVGINTTIHFLRDNGLDRYVDAYAVHIYPDTKHEVKNAAELRKMRIAKYDLAVCHPHGDDSGKPCWITEWGIDNTSTACPLDDSKREQFVKEIMGDFRPYVGQHKVESALYFAWNSTPGAAQIMASSIWRCNELTTAGKIVVNPEFLK